jgi:hypothetical protein
MDKDMSARAALAAFTALVLAPACYSPAIHDCSITCGANNLCPESQTCGKDGYCHVDPNENCVSVLEDARRADAKPENMPDARKMADAPSTCVGSTSGEPDNSCPGESTFPILEGTHQTFTDRRIFPAGDVDIYTANLALLAHPDCTSSLTYALLVTLKPPGGTNLVLRRVSNESHQCRASSTGDDTLCIPFSVQCVSPVAPSFLFEVAGEGNVSSCDPYTLDIRLCGAGSTCDSCK